MVFLTIKPQDANTQELGTLRVELQTVQEAQRAQQVSQPKRRSARLLAKSEEVENNY